MATAATNENCQCSVRSCHQPSVGSSVRTNSLLCQKHLDKDLDKVHKLGISLKQRCEKLTQIVNVDQLRQHQHSLVAELQIIEHVFDQLHERIDKFKQRIDTKLNARNQAALQCLQHIDDLQKHMGDVALAEAAGDIKRMFELLTEFELLLDSTDDEFDICGGAEKMGDDLDAGSERSFGDVSGCVKELEFVIDRHMRGVEELCDGGHCETAATAAAVCEDSEIQVDAGGRVTWVTSCNNTSGFVGDKSGRVVNGYLGDEDRVELPQPCVFVAFHWIEQKNHLLVASVNRSVKLRCHFDIDWEEVLSGLHCDSRRQLLFVAQQKSVTVADLSGCVTRVISDSSVGHTIGCINGIDGNDDKVFVFNCEEKKVLGMSKDTGELETFISVAAFHSGSGTLHSMSLLDNKILLPDTGNGRVHKVCMISKQLVTSYPTSCSQFNKFSHPNDVAVDSRGLMFISDFNSHVVRVMLPGGTAVQTLGTDGEAGYDVTKFNFPWGLTVVEGETDSHLVVADKENSRLVVYRLL